VLIDAETHQQTCAIVVEGADPQHLTAVTDPKSPLIDAQSRGNRAVKATMQADLSSARITGQWTDIPFGRLQVASDPRVAYLTDWSSGRTTTLYEIADAGERSEKSTAWRKIAEAVTDKSYSYLSENGQVLARGPLIFDPKLENAPLQAECSPQDFVGGTPWMVGLLNRDAVIGSRTDGHIVQRIPLPQQLFPDRKESVSDRKYAVTVMHSGDERLSNPVFVWCDWAHSRIIVATALHVCVAPFDKSALPAAATQGDPRDRFGLERFAVIDLPANAVNVALDDVTGQLAVTGLDDHAVSVFPMQPWKPGRTPKAVRVNVGGRPLSVVAKSVGNQRLFVVGVDAPSSLVAIDTTTLGITRQQLLDTNAPFQLLTSPNPDDPYLLATSEIDET